METIEQIIIFRPEGVEKFDIKPIEMDPKKFFLMSEADFKTKKLKIRIIKE